MRPEVQACELCGVAPYYESVNKMSTSIENYLFTGSVSIASNYYKLNKSNT